jgi:hypothetical protein
MPRIIVIGAPRAGKSTYASQSGLPHYCTDPKSVVAEPLETATYLPDGLDWSEDSDFIVSRWFKKPGDWAIEGVGAVRALRKWALMHPHTMPCDKIVFIHGHHPSVIVSDGQRSMGKAIMTVWGQIAGHFDSITEHIQPKHEPE